MYLWRTLHSSQNQKHRKLRPHRGASSLFSGTMSYRIIGVVLLFMLAIQASPEAPLQGTHAIPIYTVTIVSYSFRPRAVNITTGTNVVWMFASNGSDVSDMHTVTSNNQTQSGSRIFASQPLHAGQMFNFTFNSPGHYPYFCGFHPYMTGLVNVTGPPIGPPQTPQPNPGSPVLLYAGIGGAVVAGAVGASLYLRKKGRILRPCPRP